MRDQEKMTVALAGDDSTNVNLILGSGIKGHEDGLVRTVII